jgi:hypothetical protein
MRWGILVQYFVRQFYVSELTGLLECSIGQKIYMIGNLVAKLLYAVDRTIVARQTSNYLSAR